VTVFLQHRHDQSTIAKACISVIIFQVWFLNIQNKAFFQGKIKLISLGGHTVVTPNVPPPRGAEPIVTLGGIDLNSSGRFASKTKTLTKG
jgi:hypothetical protein